MVPKVEAIIMKYGYARVSTTGQDLQAQLDTLKREGCTKVYSEKFTGTKADRPQFQSLLNTLQTGDTLVVTKLDRFARSTSEALTIVKDLFDRGVKVHVLNMGLIENTPTGRLIFTIMSGFAEFERDLIVERTQEGKAIARQRDDFREGRPNKYTHKQIDHALTLLDTHSYKQVEDLTGISKSTLIRANKRKKVGQ
jgi:DNA invertase Pin-like site-specific DNA recombinase